MVLEIVLTPTSRFDGEHGGALRKRLAGVERAGGARAEEQQRERGGRHSTATGRHVHDLPHGSINTLSASPLVMSSSAVCTSSSFMRCVRSPSGVTAPPSSSSTARRMSSGVGWNAPPSASSPYGTRPE